MANGSVPSGSAPLYLGSFASQRGAMAQKMTDRAIELAEKERTRQGKERADMLKALSFDAVQGLGRQVQEKHLEELNSLQDKWAKKWIENGRKLTDRDYMELNRDKTEMQQRIANYKANVAQYAKVSDEIKQGKANYHPSTIEAMKNYYQRGDVGEDFSKVIKYMPDTASYLSKYADQLNRLTSPKDYRYNPESGMMETSSTNEREVRRVLGSLLANDDYFRTMMQGDVATRSATQKDVENFISAYTKSATPKTPTSSELKAYKEKQMPEAYVKAANKYGWDDMDEGEIANAIYFNDFAKRILSHDKKALELLKSKSLPNFGKPSRVVTHKDGGITLYSQPDSRGNMKEHYIPPADLNDPDNMRQAMTSVLDIVPASMQGKQKPSNIQRIIAPDFEVDVKEKAPITAVADIQRYLDVPDSKVGEKYDGDRKVLGQEDRKDIKAWVNELFPESTIKVTTWKPFSREITIDDDTYDLTNLPDRQKLMDRVTSKLGVDAIGLQGEENNPVPEPEPKPEPVKSYTPEVEARIQRVIDVNKISREEAVTALTDAGKLKNTPAPTVVKDVDIETEPDEELDFEEVEVKDAQPMPIEITEKDNDGNSDEYVVAGIDIGPYATAKGHENSVNITYNSIRKEMDTKKESYSNWEDAINKKIGSHSIVKKAGGSPLSGKMIIDVAKKYKIDPALLASIVQVDSSYGTAGKAIDTKNPVNVGNTDEGQLVYFPDWATGLEAAARFLSLPKGKRLPSVIYKGATKIVKPTNNNG